MQPLGKSSDPAPSRWSYKMQRLLLTPLFRKALRVGVPFCLTFGLAAGFLSDKDRQEAIVLAFQDLRHQVETRPEFMVKLLAVEGASQMVEEDIREIFPFDFPVSSFDIDLDEMRRMILGLPAVADADVRIRRGGTMVVEVTEREPVIVWRTWDGLGLVDREGYVVADLKTRADRPDLPVIAGPGGNADVEGALAILEAAAPLGDRVLGLVRMGERRWDVLLSEGQRILLPETGAVRAIERVIVLDQIQKMLTKDINIVDMRLAGRPTVRMNDAAAQHWMRDQQLVTGTKRP